MSFNNSKYPRYLVPETFHNSYRSNHTWINHQGSNDIVSRLKEGTLDDRQSSSALTVSSRTQGGNDCKPHLPPTRAEEIVAWAADTFADGLVMSTSFGIQAAVMLHLVTQVVPKIPVIWIDTGYLPAPTYLFAEELTEKLGLNLKIYQPAMSSARMEALHGKLWELEDDPARHCYHQIRKVEPMQRALQGLGATAWLIGSRQAQTRHHQLRHNLYIHAKCYKVLPILNWTDQDIHTYLQEHGLPYHPFFELGYTSVGDWHSSHPVRGNGEGGPAYLQRRNSANSHPHTHRSEQNTEGNFYLPRTLPECQSLDSSFL